MEPPTALPKALIQTEHDLAHFLLSPGCLGYLDWLDAISHALVGHVAWDPTSASPVRPLSFSAVFSSREI